MVSGGVGVWGVERIVQIEVSDGGGQQDGLSFYSSGSQLG